MGELTRNVLIDAIVDTTWGIGGTAAGRIADAVLARLAAPSETRPERCQATILTPSLRCVREAGHDRHHEFWLRAAPAVPEREPTRQCGGYRGPERTSAPTKAQIPRAPAEPDARAVQRAAIEIVDLFGSLFPAEREGHRNLVASIIKRALAAREEETPHGVTASGSGEA